MMNIEKKLLTLANALESTAERLDQVVDTLTNMAVLVEDIKSEITENTERKD